jgi:hypothetical protein
MRFGLSYPFNVFSPEKLAYFRLNITYLYEMGCIDQGPGKEAATPQRHYPTRHKDHKGSFAIICLCGLCGQITEIFKVHFILKCLKFSY